ncbi:carboxymuconolactone decarboxylase family protein [Burkholderia cenocepacia]|nr:carboxymuconolactone decarboxylase family protein [Burkholderia cenocepacia]MBR8470746.1 carboxymuconolactone decarboxylase family protein [Burkholderia cenocepacia]MBR8489646.1 carboxymuconolactone decarboxylase family protein [Burkholderia cenocepacia]MBY4798941.1 carboxymuconolactone decarboxylase family protein [Burkholderia cepacia]RQS25724.1 carboxymuconolactone decarboxylase [Burkholderia sp. Bp8992]
MVTPSVSRGRRAVWRDGAVRTLLRAAVLVLAVGFPAVPTQATSHEESNDMANTGTSLPNVAETLTARQQAIVPIAAFAAAGDIDNLTAALNEGLDTGLTISEIREILVQLYAYAGFPRSLNALGSLMKVMETRKQAGRQDTEGHAPSRRAPTGDALLVAGTANQTKLSGGPVKGALFDFAPAIDQFLKTHLFGDIFERDNLDWQSRELATVSMLAAMTGVDSQLQAHMRISMNVGLAAGQLKQLCGILADRVDGQAARRASGALERQLAVAMGH